MKKLISVLLVAAILLFPVSMTGCSSSGGNTISIGAVGPLTGNDSDAGYDELRGKQMAVEDFNNAGGVNGKKIKLYSEDDAGSASQSATAVTKLINQDNVSAIVGAFNSACTLADLQVLNKYKIPMITGGSSAESVISSGNKWIARGFPSDKIQINALVNYMLGKHPGTKKIGVIYSNDDYGKGGFDTLTNVAKDKNLQLVSASFALEDKDMTTELIKLKAENVDALFLWCQYNPGALIMKQARALSWNVQFYSGTGTLYPDIFSLSNNTYTGTINSVPFTTATTDPSVQKWIARYKKKFGREPAQQSARAYDSMMILLNAIKTANSTDSDAIEKAIRSTKNYAGLQGKISIDSNGEYIGDVMIVQAVSGGTWKYLQSVSAK